MDSDMTTGSTERRRLPVMPAHSRAVPNCSLFKDACPMISKDLAVSDGFRLSPASRVARREGGTIGPPLRRSSRHVQSVAQFCPNFPNAQYLRDFRHFWAKDTSGSGARLGLSEATLHDASQIVGISGGVCFLNRLVTPYKDRTCGSGCRRARQASLAVAPVVRTSSTTISSRVVFGQGRRSRMEPLTLLARSLAGTSRWLGV